MNKKIICLILCVVLISTTASALIDEWNDRKNIFSLDTSYPDDLSLLIYSGGSDTWSPIYLLYLDTNGEAYYYILSSEERENGNFELITQFTLSEDDLNNLWETITSGDFFNLDSEYSRDSVVDGSYANIEITGNGVTHSVQTVNIDIDKFDNIVKMMNTLSPGDNDLYYDGLINHAPLKPGVPIGPQDGEVNTMYSYSTNGFDIDDDKMYVMFDWGDETDSGWQGPYGSNDDILIEYTWEQQGNYNIRVKTIDDPNDDDLSDGIESEWSDSLAVSMPKTKLIEISFFLRYLERLFIRFPFLKNIIYPDDNPGKIMQQLLKNDDAYDPNSGTRAKRNGCAITIEIHITFYGEFINNAPNDHINIFIKKVEEDIENKWNKAGEPWRVQCESDCDFLDPGCTVTFDAIIDYEKNADSDDIPTGGNGKPGKQGSHWIRVPNTPEGAHVLAWDNKLPTPNNGMETTGVFNVNDFAGVYAHEAGHLMGLPDQQDIVEVDNPNGPGKVKVKVPRKNDDGSYNVMAWPSGDPDQDDINTIVDSSGVDCPCECCEYPWVFFIDYFEDPDGGWTIIPYDPNTGTWKRELYDVDFYEPPGSGLYYMEADSKEAGSSAYFSVGLFTPAIDLSGFNSVILECDRNFQDITGQSRAAIITYSGGLEESNFEEFLLELTTSDPEEGVHTELTFDPSRYKDPSEVYINFYYIDNGIDNEKFCIDNVIIGAN